MPSFGKNGFKHNLAKRQAEENTEEGMEEGRGWKNKEKKRKNKKEKKRRKKFDTDLMEEESGAKEEDSSETETSDKAAEAPFTSGLQFSAYSPQPQVCFIFVFLYFCISSSSYHPTLPSHKPHTTIIPSLPTQTRLGELTRSSMGWTRTANLFTWMLLTSLSFLAHQRLKR